MAELKRSIFGRARLFCILLLLSACSQSAVVRPAPVQLLFPTNTSDFIPPTGAPDPSALAPTQLPATNPPGPQAPAPTLPPPAAAGSIPRPTFDAFVSTVKNGKADQIVGVYVQDVLALRVVQQPPNRPDFVSIRSGDATQFLLAFTFAGNTGLLAHNFLSGKLFFNLKAGDVVEIIYGDGSVQEYEVDQIESFQALKPDSPTSDFLDLAGGDKLTASDLFYRVYGGDHHVTFQTCIDQDNNSQWGRFFVMANPM